MKLSERLKSIADLIEKDVIVGDIGSDHGYLMAYLVEKGIISKGIASDINEGPVQNCLETIRTYGFEDQIDVRLGGGLDPYKRDEIHTAVIAGMGGQLIRDIIIASDIKDSINTFILQPMTGQNVLRAWLMKNNFNIVKEVIANEQDRFYEILVVKKGLQDKTMPNWMTHMTYDEPLALEIGFKTETSKAHLGFISKKISKYEMIKGQIEKNHSSSDKLVEAKDKLQKLNEVKKCILTSEK
jgi:tRNA (adenine22-N1)-methyltransferase